jgi:hypothetical protein
MIFDRLFERPYGGTGGVPAVYPDLDPLLLERFLTEVAIQTMPSE